MNGKDMKEVRLRLGLTLAAMSKMLGYKSEKPQNLRTQQQDLENGSRNIREPQRRLTQAYLDGYRPSDWPDA